MITLNNIDVTYKKNNVSVNALKQINLTINDGEFVTIRGKSGSGKSTLLNVLGGLLPPSSGGMLYDGEEIYSLNDTTQALFRNKRIGFIVQNYALISMRTALENVLLPLKYRGISKKEARKRGIEALTKVGLEAKSNLYPYELSGGEQQRIAIARIIVAEPEVILADEPTGALDEENGRVVLSIIKKLHEKGSTIILVTHDKEIAEMGSRQLMMKDGQVTEI